MCMLSPITLVHSSLNPEVTFQLKAGEICIGGGGGGKRRRVKSVGSRLAKGSLILPTYPPSYLPISTWWS